MEYGVVVIYAHARGVCFCAARETFWLMHCQVAHRHIIVVAITLMPMLVLTANPRILSSL